MYHSFTLRKLYRNTDIFSFTSHAWSMVICHWLSVNVVYTVFSVFHVIAWVQPSHSFNKHLSSSLTSLHHSSILRNTIIPSYLNHWAQLYTIKSPFKSRSGTWGCGNISICLGYQCSCWQMILNNNMANEGIHQDTK